MVVGHYIDEKSKTSPIINFEAIRSILAPSIWFFLEYLSVFVFSMAFVYLMGRLLGKRRLAARFFYNLFARTDSLFKRCLTVGLFFISHLLFTFIVQQILTNNVKTGKSIEPINDHWLIRIKTKPLKPKFSNSTPFLNPKRKWLCRTSHFWIQ